MTPLRKTAAIVTVALASTACGDDLGLGTWVIAPDTALIYSISRPELLGQPSAYDFVQLRRVVIESPGATGLWDVALAEQDGEFVFIPASAFPGIESRTGLSLTTNTSLESLTRAPGDTSAYRSVPVTLQEGGIYVIRTRTEACPGFGSGSRYGKFEVLSLEPAIGAVRIVAIRNPLCSDRNLVPPDNN
ncbi:MAG: hypothetical protein ACREL7_13565 [Longimicrobiales bacterium]